MLKRKITDSKDTSLSKRQEIVKDLEAWCAVVHGVTKSWTKFNDWTTATDGKHVWKDAPHPMSWKNYEFQPWDSAAHLLKVKKVKSLSHVRLFATPWTVAYQAPLSMGFSRQESWSGLPFIGELNKYLLNKWINKWSETLLLIFIILYFSLLYDYCVKFYNGKYTWQ